MLTAVILLFLFIWLYRKKSTYNPYDVKYSHSSYYDCTFTGPEKCTKRIRSAILQMAGYCRLLPASRLSGQEGQAGADLLLIHESGIYAVTSADLAGSISGNPSGRYWIQSFRSRFPACRNFVYSPFLINKRSLDLVQWECRDMPALPCYSLAVFGPKGILLTSGNLGENRWAVTLTDFPGLMADIMRHNRRYLKPEQVELIYERLEEKCGKDA